LTLKARFQVQVATVKEVLEIQNTFGGGFMSDGSVPLHKLV